MKYLCPPRLGLTAEEVTALKSKLHKIRRAGGTDWKSLDDFCQWAVEAGYKTGMRIKKFNEHKPHSRDNSFFAITGKEPETEEQERHATYVDAKSPYCEACDVENCPSVSIGCFKWREYFVNNWNKNICRNGRPVIRSAEVTFRYEHPDLVREGILFEASR